MKVKIVQMDSIPLYDNPTFSPQIGDAKVGTYEVKQIISVQLVLEEAAVPFVLVKTEGQTNTLLSKK